jgi:hypothetical protein
MIIAICLLSLVLLCGILALWVSGLAQEAAGREFESLDRGRRSLLDLRFDYLMARGDALHAAVAAQLA